MGKFCVILTDIMISYRRIMGNSHPTGIALSESLMLWPITRADIQHYRLSLYKNIYQNKSKTYSYCAGTKRRYEKNVVVLTEITAIIPRIMTNIHPNPNDPPTIPKVNDQ